MTEIKKDFIIALTILLSNCISFVGFLVALKIVYKTNDISLLIIWGGLFITTIMLTPLIKFWLK